MTYKIYELLREKPLSGDEIGKNTGISRAAVNKHIKKLKDSGVKILSKTGVGYQWIEDGINAYSLKYELIKKGMDIDVVFKPTRSTNNDAKQLALSSDKDIIVAAPYQLKGKGRLDREFVSERGGAYFTLVVNSCKLPVAEIMRTVLVTGLAAADAIKSVNIDAKLKWPNDVFVAGKKVAGILMELIASGERAEKLIIGIGINVYNQIPASLKKTAARLADYSEGKIVIPELIARIAQNIYDYLDILKGGGWQELKQRYIAECISLGRRVKYDGYQGEGADITNEGFLVIKGDNEQRIIVSGDVDIC
ncbi:MAG: biotin--[acetyl-CoA-carboxylase] ligase [Christensenellales bacterium]|jgi:BirA family biotin operon repressor/biotin-[acetyl-CoA-carboxylase] ligase